MTKAQDEIAGAGAGAATGAGIGSALGPEGAVAGGIIGAIVGGVMAMIPHTHPHDATAPDPIAPKSMDYDFDTPCATPDTVMGGVPTKRPVNPIETPKPKRVYEELDEDGHGARVVKHTGPSYTAGWCRDFSAIQRTRVNPVTGRIIGYKGIPRKRALSLTSKYSSFWREQKYAKPSLHASRSPGIWDSARR